MRIAVVCPYDLGRPGGGQAHTVELARRLRAAGEEVVLVAPGRDEEQTNVCVGRGVRIRANRSIVPVAIGPLVWKRVRAALAETDLVHVHEPFMPLAAPAALGTGRPTLATFHADPSRWVAAGYRRLSPLWQRLLDGARLTAVSPVAAAAIPPEWGRPEVVPIAIDVASYAGRGERGSNHVVFVGRDDPRKGLDVLLEAWTLVRRESPEAVLTVVGARREVHPAGVRMVGRVGEEEKRRLLNEAGVLVAPNTGSESFGTVLVEGMAAGCAVVASDLPAFRWVLSGAGRLVQPGNRAQLAETLTEVLRDAAGQARLAAAGRERVRAFDWQGVLERYRAIYAELVEGR